ncbi:MAG: hypothetical protein ABII74_10450 [Elusimicrobiota bacterium]
MINKLIALIFFLIIQSSFIYCAETINEDEMFSDPEMIIQTPLNKNNDLAVEEKKSLGFSGEITSAFSDIIYSTGTRNALYTYTVANAFFDVRMRNDLKAFANLETTYWGQSKTSDIALRELFFDFDYRRRVYLRTGKQVLQWGRCYLWNPTDLINIEKKSFVRKIGYREGAYGMKLQIPFGTKYNIYSFLDTGNAASGEDVGAALKFEFLTGKTEMAFSGWTKKAYHPVFGYDFSTRIKDLDVVGELTVSQKDNTRQIREEQGQLEIYQKDKKIVPKTSLGLTKGFRLGNFNDCLSVTSEFYYNHNGYQEDLFNDPTVYPYRAPIVSRDAAGAMVSQTSGTKKDFLTAHNLYEVHNYSRCYGAIFASVGRLFITELVLNINYIRNFHDRSGIISSGLSYKNLSDFSAGILFNTFLGKDNREYTFNKEKHNIQLTCGVAF